MTDFLLTGAAVDEPLLTPKKEVEDEPVESVTMNEPVESGTSKAATSTDRETRSSAKGTFKQIQDSTCIQVNTMHSVVSNVLY